MSDNDESVLQWFEGHYDYFIAWTDNEGDFGLSLGESMHGVTPMPDHDAAVAAAMTIGDPYMRDGRLVWRSQSDVKKALRAAKAAVEAWKAGLPLPDWAVRATAEGWKPPKGWSPKPNDDIGDKLP